MKKFIFSLVLIGLFLFSKQVIAQYETMQAIDFFRSTKIASGDLNTMLTEEDIEGSPYLNDEFINGTIYTTSQTKYVDVPLRYNIFNEQLEFKTGDGQVRAMVAPETVEKIEFEDFNMVYIPYTVSRKIRRGFFREVEVGDKAALLSRPQVLFEKAEEPGAYKDAEPPKFVRKSDEYFIRVGKEAAALISSKKDLENVFPDHKPEVNSFIKKNKVKPNKPELMAELVRYYNSL